jgi:hypothetical protein
MTGLGRQQGWPGRNYSPFSVQMHIQRHPQLYGPPRTLQPPFRSGYDAEVLRRFPSASKVGAARLRQGEEE